MLPGLSHLPRNRLIMRLPAFAVLAVVLVTAWPAAAAAPSEEGAKEFISRLAEDAISSLTGDDIPRDERIKNFRVLFNERFAVGPIGRFVLGRNWNRAANAQKREFLELFEDLMVVSYVDKFARYSGEKLAVNKAVKEEEENRYIVYSSLVRPNSANKKPVEVLWRLGYRDNAYKVLDVLIEGASMGLTYRTEFDSIVRNEGVDGLLAQLRDKTDEINSGNQGQ